MVLFKIFKDDIATEVILKLNTNRQGEVHFDDLSFSPFHDFPNVSLELIKVRIFEEKVINKDSIQDPIVALKSIYVTASFYDLIRKKIVISKLEFEDGYLNLISSRDGQLNIEQAFFKTVVEDEVPIDSSNESDYFDFELKLITLKNVEANHFNEMDSSRVRGSVSSLHSSLKSQKGIFKCDLEAFLEVDAQNVVKNMILDDVPLSLKTSFETDQKFDIISFNESELAINNAALVMNGEVDLRNQGFINLEVYGNDPQFSLLNLFLSDKAVIDISSGLARFNATVKGKIFDNIPIIKGSMSVLGLSINSSDDPHKVQDLNIEGSFDLGANNNLSEAEIHVSSLKAKLPKGKIMASMSLVNFEQPRLSYSVELDSDLEGLENILNLGNVNNLSGSVDVKSSMRADFSWGSPKFQIIGGQSEIELNNLSFIINQEDTVEHFSTKLFISKDSIDISNLEIQLPASEMVMSGRVLNSEAFVSALIDLINNPKLTDPFGQEYAGIYSDVDLAVKASVDLTEFDVWLSKYFLDSIRGIVNVNADINGKFEPEEIIKAAFDLNAGIEFQNVDFLIENVNSVKDLNGFVQYSEERMSLNGLKLNFGQSDIHLQGYINNASSILDDGDQEIAGELSIRSQMFSFDNFFKWDSVTAKAFPYNIRNLDLIVKPRALTSSFKSFGLVPEMKFEISSLSAEVIDFLPPIDNLKGTFWLGEKDSALSLEFNDFYFQILEAQVQSDLSILKSKGESLTLNIKSEFANVNPRDVLSFGLLDSVPEILNTNVSAMAELKLDFMDSVSGFNSIEMFFDDLVLNNDKDTISVVGCQIDAKNLIYDIHNFSESLSFNADLSYDKAIFNNMYFDDRGLNIDSKNQIYQFTSSKSQFFGGIANGKYSVNLGTTPPTYKLQYEAKQFEIGDMLVDVENTAFITGKMDLAVDLASIGEDAEEVISNLKGSINAQGKNLLFTGVDIDKLIDRLKRSQKVTFADVGAVFLMGPGGLLISKGTDYTGMFVVNQNAKTEIRDISNDYRIDNGKITLLDFAFSTSSSMLAAKGWLDLNSSEIDITVGVLNKQLCSIFSQRIYGNYKDTQTDRVNAKKMLLAPITDLTNRRDCVPFYHGQVKYPE